MKRHRYALRDVLEECDVLCNWCGGTCTEAHCTLQTFWDWSSGIAEAHLCKGCWDRLASLFSIVPSYNGDEHIINEDEAPPFFQKKIVSPASAVTVTVGNSNPSVTYVYGHASSSNVQLIGNQSYYRDPANEGSD